MFIFILTAPAAAGEREDAAWETFKAVCVADDPQFTDAMAAFEAAGFTQPQDDALANRELRAVGVRSADLSGARCMLYLAQGDRAAMEALILRDFGPEATPLEVKASADTFIAFAIKDVAHPLRGAVVGVIAPHDPRGMPAFAVLVVVN